MRRWRRSNNDDGGFRFVGWLRAKEKRREKVMMMWAQ